MAVRAAVPAASGRSGGRRRPHASIASLHRRQREPGSALGDQPQRAERAGVAGRADQHHDASRFARDGDRAQGGLAAHGHAARRRDRRADLGPIPPLAHRRLDVREVELFHRAALGPSRQRHRRRGGSGGQRIPPCRELHGRHAAGDGLRLPRPDPVLAAHPGGDGDRPRRGLCPQRSHPILPRRGPSPDRDSGRSPIAWSRA